ncbi:Acylneuraminate cytidylyltransferase [uncultured Caudovirales phage]|uniref:Acylneuraminate cytidylyltransferase n=1 Tax=uncultured Caudovirales phage TaxID=2100421 RepID=A0A6J5PJY0_9CAUD|nr:Acylneuraminate cytidylyltransferase [uncultured Caudovirales phage]CAB4198320.1 Acylneuraminate cytidylyltransferase [uncultured Caudovirales phage]
MTVEHWFAIVPARAGSVRVPGKNRRIVDESSLCEHAMRRAEEITGNPERVIVTTDDIFVADVAQYRGHRVIIRPEELADGAATIAQVVDHAVNTLRSEGTDITKIAVCQPTSPNLYSSTVIDAVTQFENHDEWQSLALVVDDTHLMWADDGTTLRPLFTERVNRQQRTDIMWRETGGLMLVKDWVDESSLVSESGHHLFPIDADEAVDIDTISDLIVAQAHARSSLVEWHVCGGETVGYGHVFRSLALANEMPHHLHRFIVDGSEIARTMIGSRYPVISVSESYEMSADIVVFDCLHVTEQAYKSAREELSLVVGIEIVEAPEKIVFDLYLDELYAPSLSAQYEARHLITGPRYATLRDEFRAAAVALQTGAAAEMLVPGRILVTFGGADPEKMTDLVLSTFGDRYDVRAIIGPGFDHAYSTALRSKWHDRIIEANEVSMSREMLSAALVITSAGRTAWEAASLGCEIITIPVNERERDHLNPPNARRIPAYDCDRASLRFLADLALSTEFSLAERRLRALMSNVDGHGARRFAWLIDGLLEDLL